MSYPRIVNAVFNSPWAIHRPWLGSIFQVLHSRVFAGEQEQSLIGAIPNPLEASGGRARGGQFAAARWGMNSRGALINHSARIHAEAARRADDSGTYYRIVQEEEAALDPGQILHVFGSGILGKHLTAFDEICAGGLSVDRIQAALKAARDDSKVSAIVLHLDTPGGVCYGMPETAALVRSVRDVKTIVAFCDSLTASAGMWCTCCADAFYVTPSADVGSIGVYSAVVDYTEWCAKNGIKVDLIKDGTYKGAGFPGTSLTDDQRAKIQADVMACSASFKADVRAGRGDVSADVMQGQCFFGKDAIQAGLADTLVTDLDAVLSDVAKTL